MTVWTLLSRLWRLLVSMRTTAVLLAVLSALMFVNVAIPQRSLLPEAYAALVKRGPFWKFLVEDAGLGHLATSVVFRLVLWAFFLSLAAVLVDRTGTTLRRLRVRVPTAAQVEGLAGQGTLPIAAGRGWSPEAARAVLEGFGYRVADGGERALWGVRNPAALIGFPLFHLSFFVLCAAGLQLYLTRDVALALAAEGQRIRGADLRIERRAPAGDPPDVDLVLERVDPELSDGRPLGVTATLRPTNPGDPPRSAQINRPAEWGSLSVLVDRIGLAPVLRLSDGRGFTVDRVGAVIANTGGPTTVALDGGRVRVTLEPIPLGPAFPMREALPRTSLRTRVEEGQRVVFDGLLAPGQPVGLDAGTVIVEELRYWLTLRFVHERGGPLLVFGFALMVVGVVWRMVWFRREVAVVWDGTGARIGGRSEFYPARFREELASLRDLLEEPGRVGVSPQGPRSGE